MTDSSTQLEFFKKEAKKLFKQIKSNNTEAIERVSSVLKDSESMSLMRIQHVVAVEYGFLKWENLINASEVELRMAITRKKNSTGTPLGIFLRGTGIVPTSPHFSALADMVDKMTYEEQRRYLDEDARRMGVFSRG